MLKFNVTDNAALINEAVDCLDEYFDQETIDHAKSYVRLYTEPVVSAGIYDPITFNYPLAGLYHIGDEVNMNITLSLDWGSITDIRKVSVVG